MIAISSLFEEYKSGYESKHKSSEPTDKTLWSQTISRAKQKFDKYPSQVANWWVSKQYRKAGGKFK